MKKTLFAFIALLGAFASLFAQVLPPVADEAALAAESEAKSAETAASPATPEQIIAKVGAAAAMLEKEGMASIRKLQGKDSEFLFGGTYIWAHDINNVMILHPLKHKMNGKDMSDLCDNSGKAFFAQMTEICKQKGSGWISYMWPKPGEKTPSKKVSYSKSVVVEGKTLILCCGAYDYSEETISALIKGN